jgi:hypothetical protein
MLHHDQLSVSESAMSTMGEESPASVQDMMQQQQQQQQQHISPTADLDFDLMWPDAEDLFETLLATETTTTTQWQMPLTTLPISSRTLSHSPPNLFDHPHAFGDRVTPIISPIPSGESHKAVHNVSEMVSSLVRAIPHGRP